MNDSTAVLSTWKSLPSESSAHQLQGEVIRAGELKSGDYEQMYILLSMYFAGTTEAQFQSDLGEKEWVILLREQKTQTIQGFSTLMQFRRLIHDRPVIAFFSGDTIIAREYWGETILPKLWSRHVFRVADEIYAAEPDTRVYWFLICSGYKTYRFLPVFFQRFFPSPDYSTPPEIKFLRDELGSFRFGDEYDSQQGVVRFKHATPLKDGVAAITEQRLRDPHIAFFEQANPGHLKGDELACLCEIRRDNLTRAGKRMVGEIVQEQ